MARKYHNHTLQTNPWLHEVEIQNSYSRMTSDRQLKLSDQLSRPQWDDCKTRKDTKYCIKTKQNKTPPQTNRSNNKQ